MEMQHWTAPDVDVRCTDEPMYRHYVVITVLRCNYVTLRYVTLGFRILHCNAQPCPGHSHRLRRTGPAYEKRTLPTHPTLPTPRTPVNHRGGGEAVSLV